ncbi:hypothetical protein ACRAVF_19110 [Bradyrhizobium oligotrophicum S58]
MTPAQYAKQELTAGRTINMPIYSVAGSVYLCDADWNILSGSKRYESSSAASADRSRIIERACKRYI